MSYRVTVNKAQVVSFIQTGRLNGFTFETAKKVERTARLLVHKRTHALEQSHRTLRAAGTNQYEVRYRVSAGGPRAPHARFYYYGTTGPITGRRGWLKLPGPNPNPVRTGRSTVVRSVRGQRPKPWLLEAAHLVAAQI